MRILIAERNPNVLILLSRELVRDGHEVVAAGDGTAVWRALCAPDALDAAVVDPDLPNVSDRLLLEMFRQKRPDLPLVLHVYPAEAARHAAGGRIAAVIEKGGDLAALKLALGALGARSEST